MTDSNYMNRGKPKYSKKELYISFLVFAGIILYLFYWKDQQNILRETGIKSVAKVSHVGVKNFDYIFYVDGKEYSKKHSKVIYNMKVGQKFLVFYNPENPNEHAYDFKNLWVDSNIDAVKYRND